MAVGKHLRVGLVACLLAACGGGGSERDDEAVAQGGEIVAGRLCASCHGVDLSGSTVPYPGTLVHPPNLTPDVATGLGTWSDDEIIAAILDGVDPDGRQLCNTMPTYGSMGMSQEQAAAVVAYLRELTPVERAIPEPGSCRAGDSGSR